MNKVITLLACMTASLLHAQKEDFGSWTTINTEIVLSPKWEAFQEMQLRSQSFYNNFYYHEVKGGIGYVINKNFTVLLGVGKYHTYSDPGNFKSPVTRNEFRFWQQVVMKHYLARIKFEHRYRFENRWFKDSDFENRIRYRLNLAVPINKTKLEQGTLFMSAFDEIFLTPKAPYFARNRFFIGAGYQFNDFFSLQPAYVYQYDYSNASTLVKHFFNLLFMFDIDAKKRTMPKLPAAED